MKNKTDKIKKNKRKKYVNGKKFFGATVELNQ